MNKSNTGISQNELEEGISLASARKGPSPSLLRLRAFILGLLIIPFDNYWVLMMEKVYPGPYPTTISIFANVVFILCILAFINSIVRRILPRLALSMAEMVVIYSMVAIAAALAGHDMIPNLVGMMGYPWRYAGPENNWMNTFIPYLPAQLSVTNPEVLKPLYEGGESLYTNGYWKYWLMPCALWLGFIVTLVFVMMCINTLVRKQWTDRERLTYPLVQLPLAMTEPKGAIWRNKLFWIGFLIAFGIDLVNGLNVYFPYLPQIQVGTRDLLTNPVKPWDAMGWTPYSFYPFAIGIGYLLPADLSFSAWFFYWVWKAQMVISSAMAWDAVPDFPYVRHQAFGAYVGILVTLAWTSRNYLKQVWLRIKGEDSELDDSDEPLPYRTALLGAVIGFLMLCAFTMWIGLSPIIAFIAFLIYFVLAIAITRMRAELGPPVHDLHFSGPDYMISTTTGLNNLDKHDMVGLTYLFWFNRAYRGHPMPFGIEGMKMVHTAKSSQRKFFWGMIAAAVVGTVAAFWAYLHVSYQLGFDTAKMSMGGAFGPDAINNLNNWWSKPDNLASPRWGANFAMVGGFGFSVLLGYLRMKLAYFPFHPIGYAVSGSWSMNQVWAPLFLAWILKVATLRFGGLNAYKMMVPLFLGLILGEMVMGSILSLVGIIWDIPYYNFWGA